MRIICFSRVISDLIRIKSFTTIIVRKMNTPSFEGRSEITDVVISYARQNSVLEETEQRIRTGGGKKKKKKIRRRYS